MRYLDIIHEEGPFNCTSEKGLVNANITNIHPELTFEDNSMLIFEDVDGYYEMIGDALLFEMYNNNVILPNLLTDANSVVTDTVASGTSYKCFDITVIMSGVLRGHKFYYIQRKGANPLAE